MNTNTVMDAYTIAYSRQEMADLDDDSVSAVGLAFAEALTSGMHPTKAVWDALRATERNHLRLGWNEVSQTDDILEALMDGVICALQEETDGHIDVRWIAKNAIQEAEDDDNFERAYSLGLALEEWEASVPTSQAIPDAVYDVIPARDTDDTAVRITEAYTEMGANDETIAAATAASSTAMGYTSEIKSAAGIETIVSSMACDEVEQLPTYLEPEWPFDEQAVEVAALPFDGYKHDAVSTWMAMHEAQGARRFGLDWIYNGDGKTKSRAVKQKAWARIRELEVEIEAGEYKFSTAMQTTAGLAAQLSPSEQAHFCNVIARKTIEVTTNNNITGLLYGAVRSALAELLNLDGDWQVEMTGISGPEPRFIARRPPLFPSTVEEEPNTVSLNVGLCHWDDLGDEEVWLKLYPGGAQDSHTLTFTEEQQGTALLRFVGNIEAVNEPENDDWRIYECKEWQQQHAFLALRGRQSFSAVSDAVKASLKNGNSKYVHSGVKAVWRRHFAAEHKRKAQLEVRHLHTTGVTVEQANGKVRFIEWNNLLRHAPDLHVTSGKRESFIAALTGIGGQAQRVAEVM